MYDGVTQPIKTNMVVGFTGTRSGMDIHQYSEVRLFLIEHLDDIKYVMHGGCIGADEQFHRLCMELGLKIEVLPGYSKRNPEDTRFRANLLVY